MERNRLADQTSPYLLQHRDNPVHWEPWDRQALDRARAEDKPILLSIGYSACHWCHVMARESFEDPETAALMNELFVNVKVDREERPDLDTVYQTALARMGRTRGWPLTMFLTPGGEPIGGGTYFPPTPRHGLPSFSEALRAAAARYAEQPDDAVVKAADLVSSLGARTEAQGRGAITVELMNHVAGRTLDMVDVVYGGIGMGPKFPQPPLMELLWRAYWRTGHRSFRDAVLRTAEHMCLGGIYDHLGGGFARYALDDRWLVPHFEKMLYDNALLISLLTRLWRETESPLFARCVEQTAGWALREMAAPDGGFAASLAADSGAHETSDGGEGAFYVWDEAGVDAVLGPDAPLFKEFYDVAPAGNWEGRTILNRTDRPMTKDPDLEDRLADLRARLWAARERRPRPERDDKVLADWNGLMIAALAEAGAAFDHPEWIEAAARAFAFVRDTLGEGGTLRHSYRAGKRSEVALLDDYAHMAHAALRLFETTAEAAYLDQARAWADVVERDYRDAEAGGYFLTAADESSVIARVKTASETSTPSGNGVMVGVLTRLYALTGEDAYRQRAEATVAPFSAEVPSNFLAMATLINNSEGLRDPVQVVVLGQAGDEATRRLLKAGRDAHLPGGLVLLTAPNAVLPSGHPAAGKKQIGGKPTAYVCRGTSCLPPVTEDEALVELLAEKV